MISHFGSVDQVREDCRTIANQAWSTRNVSSTSFQGHSLFFLANQELFYLEEQKLYSQVLTILDRCDHPGSTLWCSGGHWSHSWPPEYALQPVSQTPESTATYWYHYEIISCQRVSNPQVMIRHFFKYHTTLSSMPFVQCLSSKWTILQALIHIVNGPKHPRKLSCCTLYHDRCCLFFICSSQIVWSKHWHHHSA